MMADGFQGQGTKGFFTKLAIRCQDCFKLKSVLRCWNQFPLPCGEPVSSEPHKGGLLWVQQTRIRPEEGTPYSTVVVSSVGDGAIWS